MDRLPKHLRRSLTWDQGKEMAEHARFTADTGIPVFFCDPRSQADLDLIAAELNARPRQILSFKTPSRVLAEALR
jgi:transposase, IS30 family